MIDIAIAIDGEARTVSRVSRASGSYNADGEFVDGAATTTSIRAAIFPASGSGVMPTSGNKLTDKPEGIRTEADWICFSRSSLAVDDQIVDGGVTYRVLHAWPRPEGGFYRAALGRLTP